MKLHVLKFTDEEFAALETARFDIGARARVDVVRAWLTRHEADMSKARSDARREGNRKILDGDRRGLCGEPDDR